MALDIVAIPGATDANSFVSLDDAELLVSYEPEATSDAWDDLDDDQKTRALVGATRDIDGVAWIDLRGDYPTSDDQALTWPRGGSQTLPRNLVLATVLLALDRIAAYSDTATADDLAATDAVTTSNIQEDTVGPITTKFFAPSDKETALAIFPQRVRNLLYGLASPILAKSTWGSSTVVRAS